MNSLGTKNRSEAAIREEKPLDALLVYEDFSTGLRAKRLLDQVVNTLGVKVDPQVSLWRFDLLRDPALLRRATEEASEADIVFLSAHGLNEPPVAVDFWFKQWLVRRGSEPCALVISLDASSGDSVARARTLEALRAIAGPAGVEVFVQAAETPRAESEPAVQNIRWRAETRTPLLDETLHRTETHLHREWGINE